ncbi:hypothetical protein CRYUN_Cryun33cG0049800 [Craigia yunnanensis]
MANSGRVEAEYESEQEESVLLRRRREASDDDREVEEEENKMAVSVRINRSVRRSGYADELDGCGGAPEYYEDDDGEEVSFALKPLAILKSINRGCLVHKTSNDYHQGRNKNNTKSGGYKAKEFIPHSKSGNNGSSSKIVKGRGPVRYKPRSRSISVNPPMKSMQLEKTQGTSSKKDSARVFSANNKQQYKRFLGKTANADSEIALSTKSKQPGKPFEMTGDTDSFTVFSRKSKKSGDIGMASFTDLASISFHGLNVDCDSLPFDEHLLAPSMSSYQEAFYPTSTSHQDNFVTQKRMVLPGSKNAVFPASVLPNLIIHAPQANEFLQGNIAPDIPYAKEGVSPVAENYFTKFSFEYSVPGSTYMASPESRDQRIGSSLSIPFTYQATPFPNQLNRVSSQAQPIVQQMPVDSTIQPPSEVYSQQLHSPFWSGSQKLFEASSLSFHEPGTFESLTGSIQSKVASLGIGSNVTSPPQYNGIQGDQNFNAIPVLFLVIQFGGLHHESLGDPAIDMTSTGYSGESQVHLWNPELTWLPILPAAAGAVGSTFHHPCFAPDGSCYGNLTMTPFIDIASCATCTSTPSDEACRSGPSNGSLPSLDTDYVKKTAEQMNNECGIKQFKPTRQVDSLYVCIWIDEPLPLSYGCLFLQVFKDEREEVKCNNWMLVIE